MYCTQATVPGLCDERMGSIAWHNSPFAMTQPLVSGSWRTLPKRVMVLDTGGKLAAGTAYGSEALSSGAVFRS